ncbi:hypothetical protein [Herbaspirillum frisingense]|uniref:hypothetical protein n=1 Tax=Herbaspirillum frisingense TaxID=92645 RepID=UPI0039AF2982
MSTTPTQRAITNPTSKTDMVSVPRAQLILLRVATLQYAAECRSHAREATNCGQDDLKQAWTEDAKKFQALYYETEGK